MRHGKQLGGVFGGCSEYDETTFKGHIVIREEEGLSVGRDHANGIKGFWPYAKD